MKRRLSLSRNNSEPPAEIESTARTVHGADLTPPIAQTRPEIRSNSAVSRPAFRSLAPPKARFRENARESATQNGVAKNV